MSAARNLGRATREDTPPLTIVAKPAKAKPAPKPRPTTKPTRPTPAAEQVAQTRREAALRAHDTEAMLYVEAQAYSLLSRAEERALARRARDGDEAARDELVTRNIRLVMRLAARYTTRAGMERADLVGAGMFGLLRAVEGFDPERGQKFSTYATWWIKQAITRYQDDRVSGVRLPAYQRQRERVMNRLIAEWFQREQRAPTDEELVAAMNAYRPPVDLARHPRQRTQGSPPKRHNGAAGDWAHPVTLASLRQMRAAAVATLSLDQGPDDRAPVAALGPGRGQGAQDRAALGALVADPAAEAALEAVEDGAVNEQIAATLQRMLRYGRISAREVCVLARRFGLGETLEETGRYLGVTRERARQLQASGLRKTRTYLAECGARNWGEWVSGGRGIRDEKTGEVE